MKGVKSFMNYIGFFAICLAVFLCSFFKLIITNTALSVFMSHKLNYNGKKIIIKASLFSLLSEIIAFSAFSLFWAFNLMDSVFSENVLYRFIIGVQMGIITNFSCFGCETLEKLICVLIEFIITVLITTGFNYFIVYREKEFNISPKKRLLLSLLFALICAPYQFFIPISRFNFFNNAVMNWLY